MDLCLRNIALSNYSRQSAISSPAASWHPFNLSKQIAIVKFPRKWNQIKLNLEAKVQLGLSLKKKKKWSGSLENFCWVHKCETVGGRRKTTVG